MSEFPALHFSEYLCVIAQLAKIFLQKNGRDICVLIETSATTFIPQLYAVFFSLFTGNNLKSLKRRFLLRKRKLKPGGQRLTMAAFQDINNGMV